MRTSVSKFPNVEVTVFFNLGRFCAEIADFIAWLIWLLIELILLFCWFCAFSESIFMDNYSMEETLESLRKVSTGSYLEKNSVKEKSPFFVVYNTLPRLTWRFSPGTSCIYVQGNTSTFPCESSEIRRRERQAKGRHPRENPRHRKVFKTGVHLSQRWGQQHRSCRGITAFWDSTSVARHASHSSRIPSPLLPPPARN